MVSFTQPNGHDRSIISEYLNVLQRTIDAISQEEILAVAKVLRESRDRGRMVYTMGNGGSGATASHFAGDLNKGASHEQVSRFKAVCLNDNYATYSAYANDIDHSQMFVEPLKNFLVPGDLVIGISGSGNSANVVKAMEYARAHGGRTLAVVGFDGGELKTCAEMSFHVPINDMQISEDLHMVLVHVLVKALTTSSVESVSPAIATPAPTRTAVPVVKATNSLKVNSSDADLVRR